MMVVCIVVLVCWGTRFNDDDDDGDDIDADKEGEFSTIIY